MVLPFAGFKTRRCGVRVANDQLFPNGQGEHAYADVEASGYKEDEVRQRR